MASVLVLGLGKRSEAGDAGDVLELAVLVGEDGVQRWRAAWRGWAGRVSGSLPGSVRGTYRANKTTAFPGL